MRAGKTLVVGLTGGIASGKSSVARLLEDLGAAVHCSDEIVRDLQAPGGEALEQIAESFGREYLTAEGELDRAKLGALVFDDPEARQKLNDIIHPAVFRKLREGMERAHAEGEAVVVLDIPLLLEGRQTGRGSGALLPFDVVVLVYADVSTQVERVVARDGLSVAEAEARIRSQLPIDEKRALADIVIDNGGDWESTDRQVRELWKGWSRAPKRNA